jgi:disease resistance protein RPS2
MHTKHKLRNGLRNEPETRQRTKQAQQSFKMNLNNISSSSMSYKGLNNITLGKMEFFVERGRSSKRPVHKRSKTRRYVLPTTKLVGQAFERNRKVMNFKNSRI